MIIVISLYADEKINLHPCVTTVKLALF